MGLQDDIVELCFSASWKFDAFEARLELIHVLYQTPQLVFYFPLFFHTRVHVVVHLLLAY